MIWNLCFLSFVRLFNSIKEIRHDPLVEYALSI